MLLQHIEITLSNGRTGVFTGQPIATKEETALQVTSIQFHDPVEMPQPGIVLPEAIAVEATVRHDKAAKPPVKRKPRKKRVKVG